MIFPIISYGHSILRQQCNEINSDYPHLQKVISNMWETLYSANGVGLAAPQINLPIKLFVVDTKQVYKNYNEDERLEFFEGDEGLVETFINARIIQSSDDKWTTEEGCLSLPGLSNDVERPWSITIEYHTPTFELLRKTFSGYTARVIQHEYDHTQGLIFIDHLKPLIRTLLKSKLFRISKGKVHVKYKMKFLE